MYSISVMTMETNVYRDYIRTLCNGHRDEKPEMIYANRKETQPFKQLFISTVFKDDRDILWLAHKQGLTAWDLKMIHYTGST